MIIAISGKLQSGKDTIADYLVLKHGFTRIAFADKLKDIAKDLFNWDGVKDDSGRKLLQELGCQMRNVRKDVWVDYVFRAIRKHNDMNWVITDVRFLNEFKSLKLLGAKMFRVERNINRDGDIHTHPSETELDGQIFLEIINNNSTIEELYKNIDFIFSKNSNE